MQNWAHTLKIHISLVQFSSIYLGSIVYIKAKIHKRNMRNTVIILTLVTNLNKIIRAILMLKYS